MRFLWFTWKDIEHPLAGGAEVVNDELARRLVADGHEVTMVVGGFKGAAPKTVVHGYSVVRLGNRYTLYLLAMRYYRRHLQGWADVVIEEINTLPFFTRFYVREPVILFFHQLCREVWFYQFPQPLSSIGYLLEPWFWRALGRQTHVITVSKSSSRDVQALGFTNISVISEGIRLAPVPQLSRVRKAAQPTVLSLGALRNMKRTLDHIAAFDIAKKQLPQLQLVVAGASEGGYGKKVRRRIAESPYYHDITYLGRPTDAQKAQLFAQSHVLVMTSIKEGWGLVVTEAASQGTPAVVYDVDGLRDSVRHGQTGIVTKPNPASLAKGITKLLRHEATYKQVRRDAWQWSKTITFDQSYQDFWTALYRMRPSFAIAAEPQTEGGEE